MSNGFRKLVQLLQGMVAFARLVKDPNRLDEVFKISDSTTNPEVLDAVVSRLARDPKPARALKECRRLPSFQLTALARLAEGTVGRVFADHMLANGLDPAAIPTLSAKDPAEFIRAHLYETHDIWHVVTGFGTDVAGELGLQGFYAAQVSSPLPPVILAAGLLNTAIFKMDEMEQRIDAIIQGWKMGKRAQALFGVNWDLLWETPLTLVREELGLKPQVSAQRAGELAVTLS